MSSVSFEMSKTYLDFAFSYLSINIETNDIGFSGLKGV